MKLKKSRGANLEALRISFFLMGLCFSGALVLTAFEWRTPQKTVEQFSLDLEGTDIYVEPAPIYVPPRKNLQTKSNKPVIDYFDLVNEIEKSIEGEKEEPSLDLSGDPDLEHIGYLPESREEEELPTPKSSAPMFPGGMDALGDFLSEQVSYPSLARNRGVQGTVWVIFLIDKHGNVSNIQVSKGIGMGCDEEAKRVVAAMPTWIPGKQRGIPVDVLYKLPIKFVLQ